MASELRSCHDVSSATRQQVKLKSELKEVVEMWQTLWQREKVELEGDELFLERERLAKLEMIKKMASELRSCHDVSNRDVDNILSKKFKPSSDVSSATHQQVKLKSELKEVLGEAVEMWQTLWVWQRKKVELEGELSLERERLAKLAIDAEEAEGN